MRVAGSLKEHQVCVEGQYKIIDVILEDIQRGPQQAEISHRSEVIKNNSALAPQSLSTSASLGGALSQMG